MSPCSERKQSIVQEGESIKKTWFWSWQHCTLQTGNTAHKNTLHTTICQFPLKAARKKSLSIDCHSGLKREWQHWTSVASCLLLVARDGGKRKKCGAGQGLSAGNWVMRWTCAKGEKSAKSKYVSLVIRHASRQSRASRLMRLTDDASRSWRTPLAEFVSFLIDALGARHWQSHTDPRTLCQITIFPSRHAANIPCYQAHDCPHF